MVKPFLAIFVSVMLGTYLFFTFELKPHLDESLLFVTHSQEPTTTVRPNRFLFRQDNRAPRHTPANPCDQRG